MKKFSDRRSLVLALTLLLPASALADGGAPAAIGPDYLGVDAAVKVEKGEIDVKPYKLKMRAGAYQNGNGNRGGMIEAEGSAKFFLTEKDGEGEEQSYGMGDSPTTSIELGGRVRADYNRDTDSRDRLEIEGPVKANILGIEALDFEEDPSVVKGKKPYLTGGGYMLTLQPVYRENKRTEVKQAGLQADLFGLSVHRAIKLNGVNSDFCLNGSAASVILGENEIRGNKTVLTGEVGHATACAGVELGRVGHLTGETSVGWTIGDDVKDENTGNYNTAWTFKMVNSAKLKKIGGTPIEVGYEHEYESVHAADSSARKAYSTHLLTAGGAF